jgi:ankyrin repeat protein
LKASENGHLQVVEYLIQTAHANVNHADTDGWTALHNSAAKGLESKLWKMLADLRYRHLEIVRLLVRSGANVNSQSRSTGYTPLSRFL